MHELKRAKCLLIRFYVPFFVFMKIPFNYFKNFYSTALKKKKNLKAGKLFFFLSSKSIKNNSDKGRDS